MPSWKKVIISGSAAELSSLYAPSITGSLQGTASIASTASFVTGSNVFGPYGANSVISASYAATSSFSLATSANQLLVINKSGNTIAKGVVVHLTGSTNSSDTPYITTASYESDSLSANSLGITAESIAFNSTGLVTTEGVLTGLNVTGFVAGQLVYLGANGAVIGAAPQAPLHSVRLGQVVRDSPSNNGSIYVRIDNGYELGELHDIIDSTTTTSYGDLLVKSGSVWTNSRQLTGSYGLTGSLTVTGSTTTDLVRITQTGTGNAFRVEDSTNPDNTPFLIDNVGNVMIGTTSSKGAVTIASNGADGLVLDIDTASNTQSSRLFFKNSGSLADFSIRNTGQLLVIAAAASASVSSGTGRMYISASGDVSIGTGYSPSSTRGAALQVSGSVNIEDGFAYKQDAENVIRIAKGTSPVTVTYTNTIAGANAAESVAYLDQLTAFGYNALYQSSGSDQTALGYTAGYQNSGSSQTLIGWGAGYQGKASNQTAVGEAAGWQNTGSSQSAYGFQAGYQNSGSNQTAIGNSAGYQNTATQQTAVGLQAGYLNIGVTQTALGQQAGQSNIGTTQTAVGYASGFQNSGSLQVAIGANAGRDNKGANQTATGYDAGRLNSGIGQTATGYAAGYENTGSYQSAYGYQAGINNSGSNQTATGFQAGVRNIGNNQTVTGHQAGYENTGSNQSAFGYQAGFENSGSNQVAMGNSAGESNSGNNQTAIGSQAGYLNTGSNQTAVGAAAGFRNSGSDNTNIGYQAGTYTTGAIINSQSAQSVFLGSQTTAGGGNRTNQIVIGYAAEGIGSNSVVLGNSSITTTALRGDVGIGTTTPTAKLDIVYAASAGTGVLIRGGGGVLDSTPLKLWDIGTAINNRNIIEFAHNSTYVTASRIYSTNPSPNATTGGKLVLETTSDDIGTFNTSQLVLSNNGNVGIGTDTPTYTLQIHDASTASIRLQETGSGGNKRLDLTIDASGVARISANQSAQQMAFDTVGSERIRINEFGNVGIGTTTPTAKLHVSGNAGAVNWVGTDHVYQQFYPSGLGAGRFGYIGYGFSGSTQLNITNEVAGGNLALGTVGNANRLFISASGNVGIGTTTPLASLHTTGSAIISGSMVIGSNSLGPFENTLTLGARDTSAEGGQIGFNAPGGTYTSASFIDLYQNRLRILKGTNATSTGEVARWEMHTAQMGLPAYTSATSFVGTPAGYLAFDSSGNILTVGGITATPAGATTQLQYNNAGALAGTSAITFDGTTLRATGSFTGSLVGELTGTASFATSASFLTPNTNAFIQNGNGFGTTAILGTTDNNALQFETNNTVNMHINADGNVGIGTTTPNAKLDVNGNTIITGSFTVTGSYNSPSGNTIDSNAFIQAGLLYLSNNF